MFIKQQSMVLFPRTIVLPCTESERKARTGVEGREEEREEAGREGTQTAEHTHAPLSNPAAGDGKGGGAERLQSADCSTWNAGLSIVEVVGTERGAIWNIYLQRNPFNMSYILGLSFSASIPGRGVVEALRPCFHSSVVSQNTYTVLLAYIHISDHN